MSIDLLFPDKSSLSILKYLATVSFIKSQDITFSFSYLNSLIVYSANSIVIGLWVKEAIATTLLNTPSNTLMFESILFAMLERI